MADAGSQPTTRPTLLVGFGRFGRDVLRRLLGHAALRGVLEWDRPNASASERRLRDLELLWIPDPTEERAGGAGDETSLEMLEDLQRQIRRVDTAAEPGAMPRVMSEAADRLLQQGAGASNRSFGLDVIVLAHPDRPEVIGALARELEAGMEELGGRQTFQRPVAGGEILNFIQILDFDDYWGKSQEARDVRKALADSVHEWEHRRSRDKAGFGRFYLVDSATQSAFRPAHARADEICLFLELLLFEGVRGLGDLQRLYQPGPVAEPAVATFGVRMMERGVGRLSRLAAARFAVGWLDYQLLAHAGDRTALPRLDATLKDYREQLGELVGLPELAQGLDEATDELRGALLELNPRVRDWPETVEKICGASLRRFEAEVAELAGKRMESNVHDMVTRLPRALSRAVDDDLHHADPAPPVAIVMDRLKRERDELSELRPGPAESAAPSTDDFYTSLARLHGRFHHLWGEHIDAEALRWRWLGPALVLACGLAPLGAHAFLEIAGLPPPTATGALDVVKTWAARSLPWLAGLFGLAVLLGWGPLLRRVERRQQRGLDFFTNREQGQFVGALRAALDGRRGAVGSQLHEVVQRAEDEIVAAVRSGLRSELARGLEQLTQRQREMRWLREQLAQFLRVLGVVLGRVHDEIAEEDGRGDVRHLPRRTEDYQRMLEKYAPEPGRFLEAQRRFQLFRGWDERFSSAFLDPYRFIDRISAAYTDPIREELARGGPDAAAPARVRDFIAFLDDAGKVDLAMDWKQQDGVPVAQSYALVPEPWSRMPEASRRLSELGFAGGGVLSGLDVTRAYLLRVQIGVKPECLTEPS